MLTVLESESFSSHLHQTVAPLYVVSAVLSLLLQQQRLRWDLLRNNHFIQSIPTGITVGSQTKTERIYCLFLSAVQVLTPDLCCVWTGTP